MALQTQATASSTTQKSYRPITSQTSRSPVTQLCHVTNKMSDVPGYVCVSCNRSFKANFTLRRHVRQAHPVVELPAVRRGRKPKHERRVSCSVCEEIFINTRALDYHRKTKHSVTTSKLQLRGQKRTLEFNSESGQPQYLQQ